VLMHHGFVNLILKNTSLTWRNGSYTNSAYNSSRRVIKIFNKICVMRNS